MRKDARPHGLGNLDRTLAKVCADWRKEREEKARAVAAMLAAAQKQTPREAAK